MTNNHLDLNRMQADLLAAIEPIVPFDGWSEPAFAQAVADLGVDPGLARVVCPRGAVDLAVLYHRNADSALAQALADADWANMRLRERIATAIFMRLDLADPELVRRAAATFALPSYAATGAKLIWETADTIWRALGDGSTDLNYYSKRMTLSAVYSASVLFWMGDDSVAKADTRAFIDHRIAELMQIEKVKGKVLALPGLRGFVSAVRAPQPNPMPGKMTPKGL